MSTFDHVLHVLHPAVGCHALQPLLMLYYPFHAISSKSLQGLGISVLLIVFQHLSLQLIHAVHNQRLARGHPVLSVSVLSTVLCL